MKKFILPFLLLFSVFTCFSQALVKIGTLKVGNYDANGGVAEISAFDPINKRLFTIRATTNHIMVINLTNPATPTLTDSISLASYGAGVNSIAFKNGVLAAAVEATIKQDSGKVVFFNTSTLAYIKDVKVGALPDMITFTPNGNYVLTANEGEPNDAYTVDPEGSVSVINISGGVATVNQSNVKTATFTAFNTASLDPSIRIFGPSATVAQDLEPEYITISEDSQTAYVTCQENNAIAVVNIATNTVTKLLGLGFKNHNVAGKGLDASDNNGYVYITPRPVYGMYQPDGIASFKYNNKTYLITANEGDVRGYTGFNEEARIKTLTLNSTAFPTATTLKNDSVMGRLKVTNTKGKNVANEYVELYSFGTRSFSIWDSLGNQIYDSGDDMEKKSYAQFPNNFNCNHSGSNNNRKDRSDDKGPEPESVCVGTIAGQTYAFIALERVSGIMVYNVTNPNMPTFVEYFNSRNFTQIPSSGLAGDLGPEGLVFVPAAQSPNSKDLLIVSNEVSGTVSIHEFTVPTSVQSSLTSSSDLTIYPNPNMGQFTLQLPQSAVASIEVYDNMGKMVYNQTTENVQQTAIQLVNVATGLYFVKVQQQDKVYLKKIIVQ